MVCHLPRTMAHGSPVRLHSSRPPPFPSDSVLLIERDMGNGLTASVRRSSDNRETYCQYADGVVFRIGSAPVEVDGWWPSDEYIPQAATYLLGSVAGLVLQNLDAVCLHASTVNIDGFAVAFVGPPGTGKSTTAAALLRRGHSIITDDVAVIDEADGQPYVRRGYASSTCSMTLPTHFSPRFPAAHAVDTRKRRRWQVDA